MHANNMVFELFIRCFFLFSVSRCVPWVLHLALPAISPSPLPDLDHFNYLKHLYETRLVCSEGGGASAAADQIFSQTIVRMVASPLAYVSKYFEFLDLLFTCSVCATARCDFLCNHACQWMPKFVDILKISVCEVPTSEWQTLKTSYEVMKQLYVEDPKTRTCLCCKV